jgi:hypothetical protein
MNLKNFFTKKIWFTKKLNFYWPVSAISIFLTLAWLIVSLFFIYNYISQDLFFSNNYRRWQFIALPQALLIFLVIGQWFARWKMKVKSISYVLILFSIICLLSVVIPLRHQYYDYAKLRENKSAPVDQVIFNNLMQRDDILVTTIDSWDSKYGRIYKVGYFGFGFKYFDYQGNFLQDCSTYDGGYYQGDRSCYFLTHLDNGDADYHQDSQWWQVYNKKRDNLLK